MLKKVLRTLFVMLCDVLLCGASTNEILVRNREGPEEKIKRGLFSGLSSAQAESPKLQYPHITRRKTMSSLNFS